MQADLFIFSVFYQSSGRRMNLYYEYVRGPALDFHSILINFIEFPFSGGDQLRCSYQFFAFVSKAFRKRGLVAGRARG